jgi:hypothetical protein
MNVNCLLANIENSLSFESAPCLANLFPFTQVGTGKLDASTHQSMHAVIPTYKLQSPEKVRKETLGQKF